MEAASRTPLSEADFKTLDQTRQRLSQLTNFLNSLQYTLLSSNPLPPPASLTSQTTILSTLVSAYQTHLTTATPLLSRLAAFPSARFPGGEQERVGLAQNLLRKKLGEQAEAWVEEGGKRGRDIASAGEVGEGMRDGDGGGVSSEEGLKELWAWAGPEANRLARGYSWGVGGVGDEDEGEGESEGDDEDDRDEDMEDEEDEEEPTEGKALGVGGEGEGGQVDVGRGEEVKKPLPLEEVLRFMTTGRQPGTLG